MSYIPFAEFFPELATKETRTLTILRDGDYDLPGDEYAFTESFCDEPGCDCRRVFLVVCSFKRNQMEAVIAYGWESREFYRKWAREDDPILIDSLKGPELNLASPRSEIAPALLKLFKKILLPDDDYVDRIKKHYRLFRSKIEKKPVQKPKLKIRKARKPKRKL